MKENYKMGTSKNLPRSEILNPSSETRKMSKKTGGVARSYVDGFFVKSDEVAAEGAKLQPREVFRGAQMLLVAALLLLGVVFTFASVDRSGKLYDIDEAAWVFDSYFYDLYLSGDLGNPYWRAFEKYAAHPPAAKYVMGALLHSIGRPMKSMEPRQYWYENALHIVRDPRSFIDGLTSRIDFTQIIAVRYLAALFAVLSAFLLFGLAYRLSGLAAAITAYIFFVFHPLYIKVASLAMGDSFLIALNIAAILLATQVAISSSGSILRIILPTILLGITIGTAFASKIVSYALVPAVFIAAAITSRTLRSFFTSAVAVLLATIIACAIAYALDPTIHGSPVQFTLERITRRMDWIEIQQSVFFSESLPTVWDRLTFVVKTTFFIQPLEFVLLLMCVIGIGFKRNALLVTLLFAYFFALTVFTTPMAWPRYIAQYLPFTILPAGLGVARFWRMIQEPKP